MQATTTYECVTEEYGDLVDGHSKYMATNHMVVQPEFKCLPLFYWLHKNPYGARFIAASPLSKLLVTNHFILCRTGVNCFWIIDNSEQVLLTLNYFSTARHLLHGFRTNH